MSDSAPTLRDWGTLREEQLAKVVVVSPHLDDAVLGCGGFMAAHPGWTVVTLYAGAPSAYPEPMTRWDQLAGFESGDEVLDARRAEDAAALAVLDAAPRWLDFVEHQYLDRPDWVGATDTAPTLEATLRELAPTAVLIPFGIANPDHDATHVACLQVRDRFTAPVWLAYEDFGYKHIPGLLAWRVSRLFRQGVWPTPVALAGAANGSRKAEALACYVSQLRALETDWALAPKLAAVEQLWRLDPPPPGWERLASD